MNLTTYCLTVMVARDGAGNSVPIPAWVPVSDEDKRLHAHARELLEIRAKCRRHKQQHDLKLVILDYLQLMSSGKKVESRQQEVSEFSRALKLLAKELQVPVIALSQLNRGSEQRQDKRPMVSDLRESGSIEQDADMVILLHREDVYDKESPRAGEADILIAKHRNGPTKDIVVAFQGHYSRFANMAADAGGGGF
jgi:replicative DNA helicase